MSKILTSKVAIIGAGFVGGTAAYALMIDGVASEIALIDVAKEKAEGEAMDLKHGLQFVSGTKITFGSDYKLCRGAEIVIITAGLSQKPGETRLDLIQKNAKIFKEMIPKIVEQNRDCLILVVTNPVDVMTYLAIKYSRLPVSRVFGSGTTLDTARFRYLLGEYFGVHPSSVHAYILGEHGDSAFPVWSTANIATVPLQNFAKFNQKAMDNIFAKTKGAAYEIIAKKGATYYAIGLAIVRIVKAILEDKNEVLPVSCLLKNYNGANDVCLSVPVILNRSGIKEQLRIPFNKKEKAALAKSANILKGFIKAVR